MVFLQGHGVSTTYAVKIYKQYGDAAIATVTTNPYQLAADIYGIGFLTADKIAHNLGVPADSEFRYRAGLVHVLSEAAESGHCYLPQPELIELAQKQLTTDSQKSIGLAAPTGRAAQRLSEMTRLEAKTLHRLLEFDPRTMAFKRDSDNPLPYDALVVDEASMLDLFLAHWLLKAVAKETQLLLVGDIDQLPSVGPGNVLQDLMASQQVPVVRLTQVFRQAATSAIITVAHQINSGQYPAIEPMNDTPRSDCLWHGGGYEPEHGVIVIEELIQQLIPKLGFNPATDVQVLCPMTRGVVGTRNLNRCLQQLVNPPAPDKVEITRGGTTLRVGDRVIQQTNDYQREVFNGDLGVIRAIDTVEQEVTVQYGERSVSYDYADLNEIALAWAVTIHKSQGSEYPVVILPLYMQHYLMLSRNLLYTGVTRAKKLAIVIGASKAVALAVRSTDNQQRYTSLRERLMQASVVG